MLVLIFCWIPWNPILLCLCHIIECITARQYVVSRILKRREGVAIVIIAVLVFVLMDCRQEMKWSESLFLDSVFSWDMETIVCSAIFILRVEWLIEQDVEAFFTVQQMVFRDIMWVPCNFWICYLPDQRHSTQMFAFCERHVRNCYQ